MSIAHFLEDGDRISVVDVGALPLEDDVGGGEVYKPLMETGQAFLYGFEPQKGAC